jgi:hypothetical protein
MSSMAKEWLSVCNYNMQQRTMQTWGFTAMQICPNLFAWNTCKMSNRFTIKKGISAGKAHQ